jgi:hypothetical protein
VIIGILAVSCNAPAEASAAPLCEHRGGAHIERHGGKAEDDRWHRAHGERVTCDKDKGNEDKAPTEVHEKVDAPRDRKDDDKDDRTIPRRDHHGFHCTWRGCG